MDLLEYKGKEIFKGANIPIVDGITISSIDELRDNIFSYPIVIKAQVPTGGRGKSGGVLFANSFDELVDNSKKILSTTINGFKVDKLLILPKIYIERELYISIMLERDTKSYLLIFSPIGGVNIEELAKNNPKMIYKIYIDPLVGLRPTDLTFLADKADLDDRETFKKLVSNLYNLFLEYHCMLVEINPLVVSDRGLIALDAKVTIDDDAAFKFPNLANNSLDPLAKEAKDFGFLYIPILEDGRVLVISNGSGMLMTSIDGLARHGIGVKAVLDLGGGAVREKIKEAVRILFKAKGDLMLVNIFGGITRCDEVAIGIKDATVEYAIDKKIICRLEGTNKEEGISILKTISNVTYVERLNEGIDVVRSELLV